MGCLMPRQSVGGRTNEIEEEAAAAAARFSFPRPLGRPLESR